MEIIFYSCRVTKWIKGKIIKKLGPLMYLIEDKNGSKHKRHYDQMQEYKGVMENTEYDYSDFNCAPSNENVNIGPSSAVQPRRNPSRNRH